MTFYYTHRLTDYHLAHALSEMLPPAADENKYADIPPPPPDIMMRMRATGTFRFVIKSLPSELRNPAEKECKSQRG